MTDTVVLLHGFAGSSSSWGTVASQLEPQRYRPLALDLRGHGQKADVRPISFELCVADLLAAAPPRFTLVGYSLGGRLALQAALLAPERINSLVLVSSSAGIEDPDQRRRRLQADQALADEIEAGGVEPFADSWLSGPLFVDDPPEVNAAARQQILANDPRALAAALRQLSSGAMEPLWDRLPELPMPVTLIAGALDQRYVDLMSQMATRIADAQLEIIDHRGHALIRSAPDVLASVLGGGA